VFTKEEVEKYSSDCAHANRTGKGKWIYHDFNPRPLNKEKIRQMAEDSVKNGGNEMQDSLRLAEGTVHVEAGHHQLEARKCNRDQEAVKEVEERE
jgi:hypothetical protein